MKPRTPASPKPIARLILPATTLALLIALAVLWQRHRALAGQHDAATHELRTVREQLAAAQQRTQRFEARPGSRRIETQPFQVEAGARAVPEPTMEKMEKFAVPFGPAERKEMQRLQALHEKAALDTRYAALFKALKLPAEKLERFKALLIDRELAFGDALTAALEQGIDPQRDAAAFKQAVGSAQAEVDRSIAELLGSSYADYQNYRDTLPQRSIVEQLAQKLSYTPEPLSEAQSAEMLRILAATRAPPPGAATESAEMVFIGVPGGAVHVGGGAPISDSALAAAENVLSSAQLQALREIQQMQQAQQEAMTLLPGPPVGGRAGLGGQSVAPMRGPRRGGG